MTEDESPLERLFPRIVKQVLNHWGQPEFEKFASELIIDSRGTRKGLPKEVLSDLLFLYAIHLEVSGNDPQDAFVPTSTNTSRPH